VIRTINIGVAGVAARTLSALQSHQRIIVIITGTHIHTENVALFQVILNPIRHVGIELRI